VEPGSPLADQCAGDLSYVAGGEIHHLYGAVRQRSWVLFLPVPWFPAWATGNQVGDPVGVARLSLRVHDCRGGAEIVSRRFVSEGLFPRLSASAAAQRAFDELMREMAGLSRADPSQPSQAAPPGDDPDVAPPDPVAPEPPPATEREDPPEPEEEREPGGLVPL
jgi:hypothetical protein